MYVAKEDSMVLSLLRRFLGPMYGLLRANFIIHPAGSEEVIGEFNPQVHPLRPLRARPDRRPDPVVRSPWPGHGRDARHRRAAVGDVVTDPYESDSPFPPPLPHERQSSPHEAEPGPMRVASLSISADMLAPPAKVEKRIDFERACTTARRSRWCWLRCASPFRMGDRQWGASIDGRHHRRRRGSGVRR